MSPVEHVSFVNLKIEADLDQDLINEQRITRGCFVILAKNMTASKLQTAVTLFPTAKIVLIGGNSFDARSMSLDRDYLTPTLINVYKSHDKVLLGLNCKKDNVNVWISGRGFVKSLDESLDQCPSVRERIKGKMFTAFGYGYVPYFVTRDNGEFDGIDVQILTMLAQKFDFKIQFKRSSGWDLNKNGKWTNGTIGHVCCYCC